MKSQLISHIKLQHVSINRNIPCRVHMGSEISQDGSNFAPFKTSNSESLRMKYTNKDQTTFPDMLVTVIVAFLAATLVRTYVAEPIWTTTTNFPYLALEFVSPNHNQTA